MHPAPLLRGVLFTSGLILAACSSDGPSAPPPDNNGPEPIALAIGDTVQLALAPLQRQQELYIRPSATTEVAIYFQAAPTPALVLDAMIDSAYVSYTLPATAGLTLLQNRTERVIIPAGKTLNLTVRRGEDTTSAVSFRLFAYRVNRAPEHGPATITPGVIRNDEDLETNADIDEYSLSPLAGREFVAYLATVGPADPANFSLEFADASQPVAYNAVGVNAPSAGVPLEDNASGSFKVPLTGTYVVRVTASMVSARPRYQFLVRPLVRAPETAPDTVGTDALISESLDYTGDVDEFTIHGPAGGQFNLLFESDTAAMMGAELVTFGDGVPAARAWLGGDAWNAATGMLTLPASGSIDVRVSHGHAYGVIGRGPYRIRVVPVLPGPETAPGVLAGSDSILTESIERWADRDEFTLNWPVSGMANLFLRADGSLGGMTLELTDLAGTSIRKVLVASGGEVGSGRFYLPAGTYRLTASGNTGPYVGPYRAYVYRISEAPETAPLTLGLGSVVNEAINPIGDRDTFNIAIAPGELFRVRLDVSTVSARGLFVSYWDYDSPIYPGGPSFWLSPGDVTMPRTAQANDNRRFSISSYNENSSEHGTYTIRVEAVPLAPESNPATLGIGSTVSEALPVGDVDQYDLVAAPNSEFALLVRFVYASPCVEVLAPDSPVMLGSTYGAEQDIGSGIIRLGPTGRARIRVWVRNDCLVDMPYKAALAIPIDQYTLNVLAVNRAPEIAPATISVGDTVRSETISHPADVDEFRFTGTAGQVVVPAYRMIYTGFSAATLRLEIVTPGGNVVGTLVNGAYVGVWQRGTGIQLPSTGTFTARLMTEGNREGMGPYEFTVGN